jgi:uncharacterized membrane protein
MKIALKEVTPLELVALRFSIGLPVLWIVLRAKRIRFGFERRDRTPLVLGAAILLVHFLVQPFALSLEGSTATNTGWIISFSPLGIALLSRLVLGERLSTGQVAGIALATLGVLLLVSKGDVRNFSWLESRGDWLIFGTAFTWALYTIATRELSRRRSPLAVTFVVFLPLCLVSLTAVAARSDLSRFLRLSPLRRDLDRLPRRPRHARAVVLAARRRPARGRARRRLPLPRAARDDRPRRSAARRALRGRGRDRRRAPAPRGRAGGAQPGASGPRAGRLTSRDSPCGSSRSRSCSLRPPRSGRTRRTRRSTSPRSSCRISGPKACGRRRRRSSIRPPTR